jgi:hypothetical protein
MPPRPPALVLLARYAPAVAAAFAVVLAAAACDDLNKPIGVPRSPGARPPSNASTDGGGDANDEGGAMPAPTITPQPGDIQI